MHTVDTFRNGVNQWLDLQDENQKIAETYKYCLCFVHTFWHKKTDKYITVAGKHQKDHLSQAETLSAGM